ncbi:MAG: cysteine desulfurase family protein [Acidobacteriota bacterium]
MRIYLDNNATTRIHPAVLDALGSALSEVWGNASSIHSEGRAARRVIEEARQSVAELIGAAPREIVFTSGGTEANNAAIHGAVLSDTTGCHIVTSSIEHPSVLEPARALEQRGHAVTYVRPQSDGLVTAESVLGEIRPETRLVSLMLANNETGVLQPAAEVGRFCRDRGIHFHCDAVQGAGKIPFSVEDLHADTLSVSAHKIHAPKGIGALYVRRGIELRPHMLGGAQERRRRAGTENVPLARAFGMAATLAAEAAGDQSEMQALRDRFEAMTLESIPDVRVNAGQAPRLPNTSNLRFPGADGETVVIALDLVGVAASTGSACSSGRMEPSHVLLEMGLSDSEARASVRFSLSRFNSREEIAEAVEKLQRVVMANRREQVSRTP